MAVPSMTCEIEFTPGVWTDVSTFVDWSAGGSTRFGRSSRYGLIQPATLNLTLANDDGRFTPGRQVLADGVIVHPYWPNVVPRKRIRIAYVISGTPYYRFTGYIKGWPPAMLNGDVARVAINATTVDERLSRIAMLPALTKQINDLAPVVYWPLNDVGSPAADRSGNSGSSLASSGSGAAVTWQDSTAPAGAEPGGTVKFQPASISSGAFLQSGRSPVPGATNAHSSFMVWFRLDPALPAWNQVVASNGQAGFSFDTSGHLVYGQVTNAAQYFVSTATFADGAWHSVAFVDFPVAIYVDGVAFPGTNIIGTGGWLAFVFALSASGGAFLYLGDGGPSEDATLGRFRGNVAAPAAFLTALSAGQVAALHSAGLGWPGETVDARIQRALTYAGLTSADWNIDASTVVLGSYDQTGKDVVTACQDATTSEGGGAAFYVGTDGKAQFRSRIFRKPGAPVLTVDAEADLDGASFQSAYDDSQIVNQVQGSRATAAGTASTQSANDAGSQAAYGLVSSSFTSYASTDADVLYNAQDQVAQQRNPGYQIPQIPVDLATATTPGLYVAVAGVDIGDRLRVTNLPPGAAPTTQIDQYAEGWADTFSTDQYAVVFDTSPADNPPWMIWDDATYGLWQAAGMTTSGAITNAGTTVVVATTTGNATFTTNPSSYPLTIQVGAEHIRLNSAPGGSASPQTFTGVTRGVDGTTAAAQASGSAVDLAPASTWTL